MTGGMAARDGGAESERAMAEDASMEVRDLEDASATAAGRSATPGVDWAGRRVDGGTCGLGARARAQLGLLGKRMREFRLGRGLTLLLLMLLMARRRRSAGLWAVWPRRSSRSTRTLLFVH